MQIEERPLRIKASPKSLVFKTSYPSQRFEKGVVDNNLYIKIENGNILVFMVYVDDIIFVRDTDKMRKEFAEEMQKEFEMSMLGELSFFLGF